MHEQVTNRKEFCCCCFFVLFFSVKVGLQIPSSSLRQGRGNELS